ncbi:hypothetical protein C1645_882465, partial [Glomus cerebriforme]
MACSKIFSGYLPELLEEIIKNFRTDHKTLHSCVLVNRLWCQLAIPLLWEDPFSIRQPKNYQFIEIYLCKLNDFDKKRIHEYGVDKNLFSLNTLFNYPFFIKYLNTWKIMTSIEEWISTTSGIQNKDFNNFIKLIYKLLFKIFIECEVNLQIIEFEVFTDEYYSHFNVGLISESLNFIRKIRNLESFHFQIPIFNNDIDNVSIESHLSQIINSQKNLKSLKISFEHDLFDDFFLVNSSLLLSNSLLSLKDSYCSNTLNTITFYEINFKNIINLNEAFENLNVLESIHFLYCYSLTSDFIQQIINMTKPFKLKSLFMRKKIPIESLESLLQKSCDYLENIGFESSSEIEQIELVKNYCTKINFFLLHGFNQKIFSSVFSLIKTIEQNLNYITIEFYRRHYISSDDIKLSSFILLNLGQALPSKLEYLCLSLMVNTSDFVVFLKKSRNSFIKKLLIRDIMSKERDLLPYVKEYIMKRKRVRFFAINEEISNDEVKEFESNNIQIVNFDDLYIQVLNFVK